MDVWVLLFYCLFKIIYFSWFIILVIIDILWFFVLLKKYVFLKCVIGLICGGINGGKIIGIIRIFLN